MKTGTSLVNSGATGFFDDVPSAECPTCLSRSKARPPIGTRVLMRTKPKAICVCGHPYAHHIHHDWLVGEQEPHNCLSCKCHDYESSEVR